MSCVNWASVEDVRGADLGGIVGDATGDQIDYWLDRARRAILGRVPIGTLSERVESGAVDQSAASDVQVDLVLDKISNPAGIRTVQESNGPTSGSVTYGGDAPGKMVLTRVQLDSLGGPVKAGGRTRAQTVATWR